MTLAEKQRIRDAVRANNPMQANNPLPEQAMAVGLALLPEPEPDPEPPAVYPALAADELIVEITGRGGPAQFTLRPFEVSRLRGRYGRGPGFEQWVGARIRDAMISFGGG